MPILSKVVFSEETFVSDRLVSVNEGTINVVGWSDGIIITNRELLYKKFDAKETTTLLNTIYTIADGNDNKEKNNVVYYVDRYNESVVAKWNQSVDYTDPDSINIVAEEIDRLIEQKYKLLLYPKYLTILGGDEIIPFYREKIKDLMDESNVFMTPDQKKDPLLKMYAYDYFPTEMKYSNVYSIPWEKKPDIATGRISSASSKDMTYFIKNSINGPSNNNIAILVADELVYSTAVVKENLEKKFVIKELSYIFSSDVSDKTKLYMKEDFKILSYAGHSNYNNFAYIKTSDFPEDNSISNNRPLITIGGCRAGLTTNDGLKWNPQPNDNNVWKFSNTGASAVLASGSLVRSSTVLRGLGLAYGEQIYNNFYKYLFKNKKSKITEPIGDALVEAINNYDEGFITSDDFGGDWTDMKARMQFILYGIPWMTFDPPITPQEQINNNYNIILTPPEKMDERTYRRFVTFEVTNFNITSNEGFDLLTIEGTSYILNDLKPILPKINTVLNLPIGSEIENISIISENKIDLGNLHIPSFQSTNTNDPINSSFTNTSDINGVFPSTRFITSNLNYQGYNKIKINLVPAQYNIDTNETFLFNTTVLEVIYKTIDDLIVTDFLTVDTNFNIY